jgi:hypothetical protein
LRDYTKSKKNLFIMINIYKCIIYIKKEKNWFVGSKWCNHFCLVNFIAVVLSLVDGHFVRWYFLTQSSPFFWLCFSFRASTTILELAGARNKKNLRPWGEGRRVSPFFLEWEIRSQKPSENASTFHYSPILRTTSKQQLISFPHPSAEPQVGVQLQEQVLSLYRVCRLHFAIFPPRAL